MTRFAFQLPTVTGAHSRFGQVVPATAASVAGSLTQGPAPIHRRRTVEFGVSENLLTADRASLRLA